MRALVLFSFVLALAVLSGSPLVSAQSSDEAAVAEAVEALRKAALAKDRSQFEALAGRIETKTQFIDDATSARSVWKFIDLTNQVIQIAGKTNPVKIGVLMVWQKQDGRWKLLARQAYRL